MGNCVTGVGKVNLHGQREALQGQSEDGLKALPHAICHTFFGQGKWTS